MLASLSWLQLEAALTDAAAAKALVTSERERSGVLEKARAAAVEVRCATSLGLLSGCPEVEWTCFQLLQLA